MKVLNLQPDEKKSSNSFNYSGAVIKLYKGLFVLYFRNFLSTSNNTWVIQNPEDFCLYDATEYAGYQCIKFQKERKLLNLES